MKFFIEGKSILTGEVIFGKTFEAETKAKAIDAARTDYEHTHSRQAQMKIDFDGWEQSDEWRDKIE